MQQDPIQHVAIMTRRRINAMAIAYCVAAGAVDEAHYLGTSPYDRAMEAIPGYLECFDELERGEIADAIAVAAIAAKDANFRHIKAYEAFYAALLASSYEEAKNEADRRLQDAGVAKYFAYAAATAMGWQEEDAGTV
jgi:hypothetical protein